MTGSRPLKLMSVVGARPQFVKAAAMSKVLRERPEVEDIVVHTGQHYDEALSGRFFDELEIATPRHALQIGSGPHGQMTGRMLEAIEKVLLADRPDWVLVYGDTNSTLAAALAAAKLAIPLVHVEAGLRSGVEFQPEEINRVLCDRIAQLLFTPVASATQQLLREGIPAERVFEVGDMMLDVTTYFGRLAAQRSSVLERFDLTPGQYLLVTLHRPANTDCERRLKAVCEALCVLAQRLPVIFPVHPRTKACLEGSGLWSDLDAAVTLVPGQGYLDMNQLVQHAKLIITDSGGLQKEGLWMQTPVLTLRAQTEWPETVALAWNRLCCPSAGAQAMIDAAQAQMRAQGQPGQPYGDAGAAKRIVDRLLLHASTRAKG